MSVKKDPRAIVVDRTEDETDERAMARTVVSPSLHAALTITEYGKAFGELELMCLVDELKDQIGQTIDGNMERAEAMLTAQAHSLDAIFSNLARRTLSAETMSGFEIFLKLGLRAQSQCRATWESLAAIKNPVGRAYVGQANFAQNQQINNAAESLRTRKKRNAPNELDEEKHDDERLVKKTPRSAVKTNVGADSHVEAVEKIDRSKVA